MTSVRSERVWGTATSDGLSVPTSDESWVWSSGRMITWSDKSNCYHSTKHKPHMDYNGCEHSSEKPSPDCRGHSVVYVRLYVYVCRIYVCKFRNFCASVHIFVGVCLWKGANKCVCKYLGPRYRYISNKIYRIATQKAVILIFTSGEPKLSQQFKCLLV